MIEFLTTPAVLTAVLCLALACPLLVWSFTTRAPLVRKQALDNLNRGFSSGDAGNAAAPQFGLLGVAQRSTPAPLVRTLDGLLARAGRPQAWPLERVLVTKLVLGLLSGALMVLMAMRDPSPRMLMMAIGATAFAWFLPEILLYNNATKRQQSIQQSLPDTLDQLTISVEAGLGFEAALKHVARNTGGPLGEEIVRTLQDIAVGQTRRQAYTALAERTQVTDLRRFIASIIQADEHGISIGRVLATQAREMRIRRRQRAEEKAMQIPVKVIFPLILFIMPVLFIVVLGPGVINSIEQFTGRQF